MIAPAPLFLTLTSTHNFLALLATPLPLQGVNMTDKKEYRSLLAEAERRLSGRTNTAANDRIKLRDAVCAFFAAERARGISIAAVQSTVEGILKRADGGTGDGSGHHELAQRLIEWCVNLDPLPAC